MDLRLGRLSWWVPAGSSPVCASARRCSSRHARPAKRGALDDRPSGPYLGQAPPGAEARLFAPGFVSTGAFERDTAFTPDGRSFYFTVVLGQTSAIVVTAEGADGRWSRPEVAPFSGHWRDLEPAIAPDGSRLYFVSNRPGPGRTPDRGDSDIWVMDRLGHAWGDPRPLGPEVNTDGDEWYPSLTRTGTVYFTRTGADRESIWRARPDGDGFASAERLPEAINTTPSQFNAFVMPDESALIFGSAPRDGGFGRSDYYISFRSGDDTWSEAVNLGPAVNSAANEYCPYVTPDGRYFIFNSLRTTAALSADGPRWSYADLRRAADAPGNGQSDIYWIDAAFLATLRPEQD